MNTDTIINAIGDIDEELFDRSEQYLHNSRSETGGNVLSFRRKRVLRTSMAAAAAVLLLFGAVFAAVKLFPAKGEATKDVVLPPSRVGKEQDPVEAWKEPVTVPADAVFAPVRKPKGHSSGYKDLDYFLGFKSGFEKADAVCLVTVENWLSENMFCTFFEASVDKVYKGELPDKIALRQEANSNYSAFNTPLFTYGNKLLVFLYIWDEWDEGVQQHENAYEIITYGAGYLIYAQDNEGGDYLIDLIGDISRAAKENREPALTDLYNSDLINELIEYIDLQDGELAKTVELFTHDTDRLHWEDGGAPMRVYRFSDIDDLLNEMAEGDGQL